MTIRETKTLS